MILKSVSASWAELTFLLSPFHISKRTSYSRCQEQRNVSQQQKIWTLQHDTTSTWSRPISLVPFCSFQHPIHWMPSLVSPKSKSHPSIQCIYHKHANSPLIFCLELSLSQTWPISWFKGVVIVTEWSHGLNLSVRCLELLCLRHQSTLCIQMQT